MSLTVAEIKVDYRSMMNERGETVTLRRYTGAGPNNLRPRFDADVMAVVSGYAPQELVGSVVQGDRKVILLAEDLIDAQFALPVTTGEKIVIRGRECAIIAADDSTRRVSGVLVALEIQCRG